MKKEVRIGITTGESTGICDEIIEKVMSEKALRSMYNLEVLRVENDPAGILSLDAACEALRSKKIDAVVTCPICKKSASDAGFKYIGHTEYFTANFAVQGREPLMFMVSDSLRVALVTKHVAINDVPKMITKDKILTHLNSLKRSLEVDFGINSPKIAVLGLNPHCGEEGMLGNEESEQITPAIIEANESGILAFGPFASDGFFGSGAHQKYDAILAMYHDQGLAPFKSLAFSEGVNFTAGLPIVRTSPAHGVGRDIVGKGIASADALRAAIYTAADVVRSRRRYAEIIANPLKKQQSEYNDGHRRGGNPHKEANVDELLQNVEDKHHH